MVDATIIHAPSSTKNQDRQRDPEMHQTKKGNQWYFGMKVHVGADVNSGLAHTVTVTPANASDISQLRYLLREDDRAVFGDKGYVNNQYKRRARAAGVFWGVSLKAGTQHRLQPGVTAHAQPHLFALEHPPTFRTEFPKYTLGVYPNDRENPKRSNLTHCCT